MKHYLLLIALTSSFTNIVKSNFDHFFHDDIINNTQLVQKELLALGFKKVFFTTSDNIKLCALFYDQHKSATVTNTIICCQGFYPGLKEGLAGMYTLVHDQPYNILLLEARGHAESEGNFLSAQALRDYGKDEYRDIVAAIEYISKYNMQNSIDQRITIYGLCAGGFHGTKALYELQQANHPNFQNVHGIIVDSGWIRLPDVAITTLQAEIKNRCKKIGLPWLAKPLIWIMIKYYQIALQQHHETIESIDTMLPSLNCPILFIHCMHDAYASINPIQNICKQCPKASCWWIDHKIHANYYAIDPIAYKQKLIEFCNNRTLSIFVRYQDAQA